MLCLSRYRETLPPNPVPEANPARWERIRFFRTTAGFLVILCTFRISPRTSRTLRSLPVRTAKPFWRVRELASSVHGQSGGLLCRDASRLHDGRALQVHGTQPHVDESRLAFVFLSFQDALIARLTLLNCEHSHQKPLYGWTSRLGLTLPCTLKMKPNRGCLFRYR